MTHWLAWNIPASSTGLPEGVMPGDLPDGMRNWGIAVQRATTLAPDLADGATISAKALGQLTLHGTTREVTVDVSAQRAAGSIRLSGQIPVTFADWNIPNPSFGPASTEDHGLIEFLLVLARA